MKGRNEGEEATLTKKRQKQHVSTHVHGNLIQVTKRLTNIQTESLMINNLLLGSVALENQRSPPCTCSWMRHSEVHMRGNTTTTNTRANVRESVSSNNRTTHGKMHVDKMEDKHGAHRSNRKGQSANPENMRSACFAADRQAKTYRSTCTFTFTHRSWSAHFVRGRLRNNLHGASVS